jgi:hypothetical protein
MLLRGVTRGVGVVPPPRAAESKWPQSGRQNEYYRSMVPRVCSTDPSYHLLGDPWVYICEGKGKAVPLQAWSGPEGSRNLRLPDFMTRVQDGGKVVSLTHRPPLPPGNTPGTHFC